MNTYSIVDLEKALAYAKKVSAVTIGIETQDTDNRRLLIRVPESFKGAGSLITIYSSESAKMPTITHTETLFS